MFRALTKTSRDVVLRADSYLSQHSIADSRFLPRPTRCLSGCGGSSSSVPENRLHSPTPILYATSIHGIRQDFSTNIIPLYPSPISTTSILANGRRIGKRWLTTDSNQNNKKRLESETKDATPQEHSSASSAPSNLPPVGEFSQHKLKDFVGSMGQQVNDRLNTGDLLSVYGIVALISVVLVAPFVLRHMRNSDSTYEEDFDGEDPVAEMAKVVSEEYGIGNAEGLLASVGVGGLDSIVADLLKSPRVQQAVTELVTKVLSSPEFKRAAQVLLRELWSDLVNDPETLAQVIHLLQNVIQDEDIKEAATQLVMEVFNDKEVLDELVLLLERLGQEKQVLAATQSLLVESAHNALNDPEILDHSMEFATDVVGDDVVQQTAGEALYNTFSYAVRPTLSVVLSIVGAALILLSASAFRNAYISDRSIDDTLATAFQYSAEVVSNIAALPRTLLVACKNAIVSVLLFPFRMVAAGLRRLGAAGNATVDAMNRMVEYMAALPMRLYVAFARTLQSGFELLMGGMKHRSQQLFTAISTSFLGAFYRSSVEIASKSMAILQEAFCSMKKASVEASSAVDDLLKGTLDSFQGAISNVLVTTGKTRRSWDQTILNGYDKLYKATARFVNRLSAKMPATAFFRRLEEDDKLAKLKGQTLHRVSKGHRSLNDRAAQLGFFIERVLASVTELVVRRDDQSSSPDAI
eukprot:scaffold5085_cov115-Cylindrotheca_fusiformis.AAC.1